MSLIGPRPERPAFCAEFEKRIHGWHYRTMIAPGLSGLAQVTGGYDLLPKEKVVLDLWGSRQRWNAREACWEPWSSWKTRLKSSGGLSLPTACSSASATSFSVMRPDIDQPTTFLWNASITAARQGHPPPVPM